MPESLNLLFAYQYNIMQIYHLWEALVMWRGCVHTHKQIHRDRYKDRYIQTYMHTRER